MDIKLAIETMIPTLLPIAAGYGAAHWLELSADSIQKLMRNVLLPALLVVFLTGPIPQAALLPTILAAVATALAGIFLLPQVRRVANTEIDAAATFPNIAVFAVPFLLLSWQHSPLGMKTATLYFVLVAATHVFVQHRQDGFRTLIREPWFYGCVAALLLHLLGLGKSSFFTAAVRPIGLAACPVFLLYVGASLHPINRFMFSDKAGWLSVAYRMVIGFAIALLVVNLFKMPQAVKETIIIAGLAPPATTASSLVDSEHGGSTDVAHLGTLVSVVAMLLAVGFQW